MKNLREIIKKIIIESLDPDSVFPIVPSQGPLLGFEFEEVENDRVASFAENEHRNWSSRNMKENSKDAFPVLKEYWMSAGLNDQNAAYCARRPGPYIERVTGRSRQGHHWSAAFISYCMQLSGENEFRSINHTPFFWSAFHNRKEFIKNPESFEGKEFYMLFFADEGVEPVRGNNLFYNRNGNNTRSLRYTKGFFEINYSGSSNGPNEDSHSDIYVGSGKAIGGNISNTVSKYNSKYTAIVKKIKGFYFDSSKVESQTDIVDINDFKTSETEESTSL
jgi:hypothetical protein